MKTQGKWKIHREVLNSSQPEYIYGGINSTHICDFRKLNPNLLDEVLEQQQDNAHLIAAVPELLEACKDLASIFPEKSMSEMDAADFTDRANRIWVAAQSAKIAIEKAEKS